MDLKNKSDKHMTPKSQVSIISKRLSQGIGTDSPFRNMPNLSTPPSRFTRIINPFEPSLVDRLHLPTFSPNVFAQNSTPKVEQKFKWTIEDISSLKPAEIDETTVSQHFCTTDDPHVESLVQQKIQTFFNEKQIVPSPMNVKFENVPLVEGCSRIEEINLHKTPSKGSIVREKETCDGATQTILTLPPILPKEVEDALRPFFTYLEDQQQQQKDNFENDSLYKKLFQWENTDEDSSNHSHGVQSILSSPAISTGFSPIQFSPYSKGLPSPFDLPELRDCNLSPIANHSPKNRSSRSVCRLDFSDKMSVDASMIVPDVEQQPMLSRSYIEEDKPDDPKPCTSRNFPKSLDTDFQITQYQLAKSTLKRNQTFSHLTHSETTIAETSNNWSMEYKQFSIHSPASSSADSAKMDVSNSNTPNTRQFPGKGQRKRLSESFKREEMLEDDNALHCDDKIIQNPSKLFRNDMTDTGYCTGDFSNINNCTNVFASTPTKH